MIAHQCFASRRRGTMRQNIIIVFFLLISLTQCVVSAAEETKFGVVNVTTAMLPNTTQIAYGTYMGFSKDRSNEPSRNIQLREMVKRAISIGYRHIDTAAIYSTEDEVGEAINYKVKEGLVKREDIFLTTKLWNTRHRREQVSEALRASLQLMELDYVDLYLIHWPMGFDDESNFIDVDYMETWRGMEDVLSCGLTKRIGLSNFNRTQLERVLREGTIKPAALQIEIHPQNTQEELVKLAQSHGMMVMGYQPFGTMVPRGFDVPGGIRMDNPIIMDIAKKYRKTPAQVVLRWQIDRNIVPVAKTMTPDRLLENLNIFTFQLTAEEVERISSLNNNTRITFPTFWQEHMYYPFEKVAEPADMIVL